MMAQAMQPTARLLGPKLTQKGIGQKIKEDDGRKAQIRASLARD